MTKHHQLPKKSHPSTCSPAASTPMSPPLSPLDNSYHQVGNERKRNTWNDGSKRKTTPRPVSEGSSDPFAGMKTCINYQQEIERLKTMVPKVEVKKRPSHRPARPSSDSTSSMTSPTLTTVPPSSFTTTDTTLTSSAHNSSTSSSSSSTSSSSSSSSSPSSSCVSISSSSTSSSATTSPTPVSNTALIIDEPSNQTPNTDTHHYHHLHNGDGDDDATDYNPSSPHLQPSAQVAPATTKTNTNPHGVVETDQPSTPVITDEEKARFLEFMKNWTGGLHGWNDTSLTNEQKGMWHQYQPVRRAHILSRSEPCSPRHDTVNDSWPLQPQPPQPYLHQQFNSTNTHLDMIRHQQQLQQQQQQPPQSARYTPTSPPPPLHPSFPMAFQQHQHLYSTSMHSQQKHQILHNHSHTLTHSHSHNPNFNLNQHQYHHQQFVQAASPMDWHIHTPSPSLTVPVGTIGDRHSSSSIRGRFTSEHISRSTPRSPNPFGVSVM